MVGTHAALAIHYVKYVQEIEVHVGQTEEVAGEGAGKQVEVTEPTPARLVRESRNFVCVSEPR